MLSVVPTYCKSHLAGSTIVPVAQSEDKEPPGDLDRSVARPRGEERSINGQKTAGRSSLTRRLSLSFDLAMRKRCYDTILTALIQGLSSFACSVMLISAMPSS